MLIDQSYFVGDLPIPNRDDVPTLETLQWFINKYEPLFLQELLGYSLYKAYKANPSAQKFLDILNGKEYTDTNGQLAKWNGLIEVIVPAPTAPATTPMAQKKSIIANYIYFKYRQVFSSQFTGIGEVVMAAENALPINPRRKMAFVWNEINEGVKNFTAFMDATQILDATIYPDWTSANKYNALKVFGFINPFF